MSSFVGRVVYYRYSCWTCAPRSSVHRVGRPPPAIGSCMSRPHRDCSRCLLACSRYSRFPSAASSSDPPSQSPSSPPTDHKTNHLNQLHHPHHQPHRRALPLKQQRRRRQEVLQKKRRKRTTTRVSIRSSRGASATRSRVRSVARSYTGYTRPIRAF